MIMKTLSAPGRKLKQQLIISAGSTANASLSLSLPT
jgi:hypothetical protein